MDLFHKIWALLRNWFSGSGQSRPLSSRHRHQAQIGVRRLEERIVLDASFAMTGGELVLNQFDGSSTSVNVSEAKYDVDAGSAGAEDVYAFKLNGGKWLGSDIAGVSTNAGDTLYILKSALNDQLQIVDSANNNLQVVLQALGVGASGAVNADLSVEASAINLNGNLTTNGKDVELNGAVTLSSTQNIVVTTTNADPTLDAGDVTFGGTVNGAINRSLTVNAGSAGTGAAGNVTFQDAIGGTTNLLGLNVTGNDVQLDSSVTVRGGGVTIDSAGSTHVVGAITTTNGAVSITSAKSIKIEGTVNTGNQSILLKANEDVTIALLTTTNTTANAVSITSQTGAIIDGNGDDLNIVTSNANAVTTLRAATGIGAGNALEVNLSKLDAVNSTSGDIQLTETNAITVLNLKQAAAGNISLIASGTVTVNDGNSIVIQTGGTGQITIDAQGASSDLTLQSGVASNGGAISLSAGRDVVQNAFGNITSSGGDVTVTSGRALNMANGLTIDSGTGKIEILATGNATLGLLKSLKGNGEAIKVVSVTGGILDANDTALNIEANGKDALTTLSAATGIGASNRLEVSTIRLHITNSTSGNVLITETDSVRIEALKQLAGSGNLSLIATNGTITVDNGLAPPDSTAVSAQGSGSVLLDAQGTGSQLVVNSGISAVNGAVTLTADDKVTLGERGDITTSAAGISAHVTVTSTNSSVEMHDNAEINAGGNITVNAAGDIDLGLLKSSGRSINVESTTGDINIDNGLALSIETTGTGTVSLRAQGTGGQILVEGGIQTATGTITIAADDNIKFGKDGDLTTSSTGTAAHVSVTSSHGAVGMHDEAAINAGGNITVKAAGNVEVGLLKSSGRSINVESTGGNIYLDNGAALGIETSSSGTVTLLAQGSGGQILVDAGIQAGVGAVTLTADDDIKFGEKGDVTTTSTGTTAHVQVTSVNGEIVMHDGTEINAGGAITLKADGDIEVGLLKSSGRNINVESTAGKIRVDNGTATGIETAGNGTITLSALDPTGIIFVNSGIKSSSGAITLTTVDDIHFGADGDITSTSGAVSVTSNAGVVNMNSATEINAGSGTIAVKAAGDVTLGKLSSSNPTASAISVTSEYGSLVDGNGDALNIVSTNASGVTTLRAVHGIGNGNALEVDLTKLDAVNSSSGNIELIESNAITLLNLKQSAAGNISLVGNGTITVNNGNTVVVQTGNGSVTITAQGGTSNLVVQSGIETTNGKIDLEAGQNVSFGADGDVTTQGGEIEVYAEGAVTMANGTVVHSVNQTVQIQAQGDVTLGLLKSGKATAEAVWVYSHQGAILDANGADLNIDANGANAGTLLRAANGIGAANMLEVNSSYLDVLNSTTGNVRIAESDDVTIVQVKQTAGSGNIELTALNGSITAGKATAAVEAQTSTISILASQNVTLGEVKTGNNTAGAVTITSQSGSIVGLAGASPNISATEASAVTTLSAATGIGSSGQSVRTDVSRLIATNSTSGEISIAESNDVTILILRQTGVTATGNIALTAAGTIIIANTSPNAVQTQGSGTVQLTATGSTSDLIVQGKIIAVDGNVTLEAEDNLEFTSTGQASTAGDVHLTAGKEIKGAAGGVHVVADDLVAQASTGITLLNTTVGTISAVNSTSGDIQIKETDNVTVKAMKQTTGSGNITLTTVNGSITVDAGSPAAVAVQSHGTGTIFLEANQSALSTSNLHVLSGVASEAGSISLHADNNVTFGNGAAIASQSGAVIATALNGALDMQGTSSIKAGTGSIALRAAGNVTLGHLATSNDTSSAVRVTSQNGSILDDGNNALLNILADSANAVTTLSAATGIGALNDPLRVDLANLVATNSGTSGDIWIEEANDLTVQTLRQTSTAGNGSINLKTLDGSLTVNNGSNTVVAVQTYGTGTVNLEAQGTGSDLSVQSKISTVNGAVTLIASGDALFGPHGDLTSTTGDLSVTATNGEIQMANGTVFNAGTGTVTVSAADQVTLGEVRTTNATANAVSITSQNGAIVDGNDAAVNIVAASSSAVTKLRAATGIGSTDTLEVDLSQLDAANSTSGDIRLQEVNAITILNLQQTNAAGNGSIELTSLAGTITVDSPTDATAVQTHGTGSIKLQSTGALSDLFVQDRIKTENGTITLQAGRHLTLDANGSVTTAQNAIFQAAGAISAAGSQLVTAAGLTATAGSGILLNTAVDTISATNGSSGNIQITEADGILVTALKQSGGSGNISLVTQNGSITVDNGQVPPAGTTAVEAKFNGNVLLQAQGTNSKVTLNSGVATSNGTITLLADGDVILGDQGDLTTAGSTGAISVTSTTGDIEMSNGTEVRSGSEITLNATQGDVTLGYLRSSRGNGSAVTITAGGAILDGNGSALNIEATTSNSLTTLSAGSGIGAASPSDPSDTALEINVNRLSVTNGQTGDIRLKETDSVSVVKLVQETSTGQIELLANGTITVENTTPGVASVQSRGTGRITLGASGSTTDLNVQGAVSSEGGQIDLSAARNVTFGADGDVASLGGNVNVTATAGTLQMADGTKINAGAGQITLQAQGTVTLGELVSTRSDAVNPIAAVTVTSTAGSIQDANGDALNINAGGQNAITTLRSATGIATTAGNPLEIQSTILDVINSTSGNVQLLETDDVLVVNLWQLAGNGNVSLTTVDGDITVDNGNTVVVQTTGVGTVTLNAQGTGSDLLIRSQVQSASGGISLQAADSVTLDKYGDVTSQAGNIGITALAGSVKVLDGRTVRTESSGHITVEAVDGVQLNGLLETTGNGNISVTTSAGGITVDNGNAVAIKSAGVGTVTLNAQGTGSDLLVRSQVQSALRGISLQAADNVTLDKYGDVTSQAGNIDITAQAGSVKVLDGRTVQTGSNGKITVQAVDGVQLNGLLETTGNGNISVTTTAGGITVDNGNAAAIKSAGVGSVTLNAQGTGSDLLVRSQVQSASREISLQAADNVTLDKYGDVTSQAGNIDITAQAGSVKVLDGRTIKSGSSGKITVQAVDGVQLNGLLETTGNGNISVTTSAGGITVDNGNAIAISAAGVGTVTLNAQGTGSDVLVRSQVQSAFRGISLQAADSVILDKYGDVTSQAGNIDITAQAGSVKVLDGRTIKSGSSGKITVQAVDGVQLNGLLETTGNGNISVTTTAGDITVDNGNAVAISAAGVGTVTLNAQGTGSDLLVRSQVQSAFREISLQAADSVTLDKYGDVTSQAGNIDITAQAGSVKVLDGRTIKSGSSGKITVQAVDGVQLNGLLETTGNGNISVTTTAGDITVDNGNSTAIHAGGVGTVVLTAQGTGADLNIRSEVRSTLNRIELTADQNVLVNGHGDLLSQSGNISIIAKDGTLHIHDGGIVETGGAGEITLDAKTGIELKGLLQTTGDGNIAVATTSGDLLVDHGNAIAVKAAGVGTVTLDAQGATSNLSIQSQIQSDEGDITLDAGNDVTFGADGDVTTTSGNVTINADQGSLLMADGAEILSDSGTIQLKAQGDITLGLLSTNSQSNTPADAAVMVTSQNGAIIDGNGPSMNIQSPHVDSLVVLKAATGIGEGDALEMNLANLAAEITGTGGIQISVSDDITLTDVKTANGSIGVIAGGNITATSVVSQTDADANDITLTSQTGNIAVQSVNAGTLNGDVILNAAGTISSIGGGPHLIADDLSATAGSGINLGTTINTLTAHVNGTGPIQITETNAITLTDVKTANGRIGVIAGGNITATSVVSQTDADANDITLTSQTGNIAVQSVNAGTVNGDVILKAAGTISSIGGGPHLIADDLNATSGSGINLGTTINTLTAHVNGTGPIQITETNAITLTDVKTANGRIGVIAGGNITATSVVSQTDADANDITLTSQTGNIAVQSVNAGTVNGDVILKAAGTISSIGGGPHLIADDLNATSGSGINLGTTINTLTAHVNGTGPIQITETNAITLTDVKTANGRIGVIAGGNITATSVVSQTDADANDITLTSQTGNIAVQSVNAGTVNGDVILKAAGTISSIGGGPHLIADDLNATSGSGINLGTTINTLTAQVTGAGAIQITETNAVTLTDVKTANGSIGVIAGGNITATSVVSQTDADANDITLTSQTGNIAVQSVNAGTVNGDVILNAAGTISSIGVGPHLIADDLNATSGSGINLGTTINTLTAQITGAGAIQITETNAITLTDVKTANGSIGVIAGGNITATSVVSQTDADANDITLTSQTGNIAVQSVNAGTVNGDVILNAAGTISSIGVGPHLIADDLNATSGSGINLGTTINTLTAQITGAGAIQITETNAITLTDVKTANGSIGVIAGGNITATSVVSQTDADVNDITLTSQTGNIAVQSVNAGTTNGDVILNAAGTISSIGGGPHLIADDLNATSGSGINLGTTINTLTAQVNGTGPIQITETNAVTLTDVKTANGSIGVIAGGNITATSVVSQTDADANDITLTSQTGNIAVQSVNAGTTNGDVILNAAGTISSIGGGPHLIADDLNATSGSGINLGTTINTLTAQVNGTGPIQITETNAVTLTDVKTANGSIGVIAGGNITATSVVSQTDADANDITLTSQTGNIAVQSVNAGTTNGDVILNAAGTISSIGGGPHLIADDLNATSGSGINLGTTINTLTAQVNGTGPIQITETNAVTLTDVKTANGSIGVIAGGNITATSVVSQTDADVNDITLTSQTGNIAVQSVNAGTTNGDVILNAAGTISSIGGGPHLIADDLNATSGSGINLGTTINTLTAQVNGTGPIQITETNAVTLTDVKTANGSIGVIAGGNITATSVVSQTDADVNDITLTSQTGNIAVQSVNAGTTNGDVILNAAGTISSIGGGPHLIADDLNATSGSGINLGTTINTLTAQVNGTGPIQITETNAVTLTDVKTANGSIGVIAGGNITATSVVSQTDADANDITLTSQTGNIAVQTVNAGALHGDVILISQTGAITRVGPTTQVNITADDLLTISASGVNLYTSVNDLSAFVSGKGDILIEESDDIRLASSDAATDDERIETTDGRIQIRAVGNITIVDTNPANDGPDRRGDEEIIAGGAASSSSTSAGRILLQAGNINGGSPADLIFQPHAQISAVGAAGDRGAIVLIATGNFEFDSATSQITTYNGTDGGTVRTPIPTIDNLTGGNPDLVAAGNDYRGSFQVKLGSGTAGENGLEIHIDWGDLGSKRYEGSDYNNQTAANGSLEGLDGESQLNLSHIYTISDVQTANGNGRVNSTDPLQVRFTVSHDPSIVILANTLNGAATGKLDGELSLLTSSNHLQGPNDDVPIDPASLLGATLANIQSGGTVDPVQFTDTVDAINTMQSAEMLDSGIQSFRVPPIIPPRELFVIRDEVFPTDAPPAPATAPISFVSPAQQVVHSIPVSSTNLYFRDEYFQIKAISPDPNATAPLAPPERLPDDILSGDRLNQLFRQLPDGQYGIDYVLGEGNERSILKFDIRQGQPVVPGGEILDGGQLKLEDITEQLKNAAEATTSEPATTDASPAADVNLSSVPTTSSELEVAQQKNGGELAVQGDVEAASRSLEEQSEELEEPVPLSAAAVPGFLGITGFLRRIRRQQQEPSSFSATGRLMRRLKRGADE
ncbi:hypothetical protein SH661x_003192 [Planctomicrobium sp. SH661]|uniref:hypothetical protein n=1 Tax=Planctomicrobium sp. SH661 TaxID=3448124 RepID=UPI003F5C9F30